MLKRYAPPALLVLALLGIWELTCRAAHVPTFLLPAPSRIATALWDWRAALFVQNLPTTLLESLLGLGVSVALAVVLAGVMHLVRPVNRALYPLIVASQTVPIVAISTLFLVWFGYSLAQKVAVVVLFTFFPVVVALMDGLGSASPELLDWLRAAGASRWRILRLAQIPAALPAFFTGVKMAAVFSVSGAVFGEYLGGSSGLGVFGRRAASTLKTPELFASVVVLALLGIVLFLAAAALERRCLRHRAGQSGA